MRTFELNPDRAERRYEIFVRRHLGRNFAVHLFHGMLGQTGFRLLNAPTFLPAYLLLLSGGSDLAVGLGLSLQSLGMMLTPLLGASLIEHRTRVLPVAFAVGALMRLSILAIALSGLLLTPARALQGVFVGLLAFGLFQGMQGVMFNVLMAKAIPVAQRGRLTGLRNFLAGVTGAAVAFASGRWLLGAEPDVYGYSVTFLLAFLLTAVGLATLAAMKEPRPPSARPRQPALQRLRDVPGLLRGDRAFSRYVLARALVTLGRMALPFYIVYAGAGMALSGSNLALMTVAFTIAATVSNLLWGALADRFGFRLVLLASIGMWILATLALLADGGPAATAAVFTALGAAVQGFQNAAMNLTLEFGHRDDLPLRLAIANSTSELAGGVGPLLGGLIAASLGYPALFLASIVFLLAGGVMVVACVPEPRHAAERTPSAQRSADPSRRA